MHSNPKLQKKTDKEVQTMIRVYPHILENRVTASVSSEKRCQTEISIKPDEDNKKYYSMLEYIPYQDIQEKNQRVLNLPRKLHLQFDQNTKFHLDIEQCLFDDDGVNELCIEMMTRAKALKAAAKKTKTFNNVATQTG